jgi:hypothetical protein
MKEVAMQGMETARGDAERHSQLIVAHRSFAGSVVASLPGPDLVTTFKLHNVISFYAETSHALFGRAAPEEEMEKEREWTAGGEVGSTAGGSEVGSLIAALRSVAGLCASRFRAILRARGDELLQLRGVLKTSLGVSSEVVEATSELTEILDIVSSSMVSSSSSGSGSGSGSRSGSGAAVANIEVDAIMAGYVEPLTRSALLSAKGLPASDTAALMINTCSYVQRALAPYDFTAWRVEKLAEELDLWMATLVREHTSVVLSRCAFGAILTAVAAGGRLRDAAGMAPAELQRAMATFYSTLTSLAVPAFDQLQVRECARAWSGGAACIHCRFSPSLLLFFSLSPKCPPCAEPAASRRGAHRERCADCCDVHADLRRGARANCGVRRRGAALHHASHTRPGPHPAWVSEAAAAGSSKRCARTRRHRE